MGKNRLVGWLLCRLESYPKAIGLLEQSLDRRLSLRKSIALKFHSFLCSFCIRFKKRLETMRQIVQTGQSGGSIGINHRVHLSLEARERVKKLLRKAIQDLESEADDTK